jgi:hypothetical protein
VALRHQLIVLRRKVQGRVRLTNNDRWFFRGRLSPLLALEVAGGRPPIETDLRALIRRMSIENPLWGAPRIHGELLKLGFEVAQSSVDGFAERLIGSIRRECVDHFVVLGEAHLRRILRAYARYYNDIRTHRSPDKDAPVSRPVQRTGIIS